MPTAQPAAPAAGFPLDQPDITVSVRQTFGIDSDLQVPAFSQVGEHVPDFDDAYRFDHDTTLAILAGFAFNRRVMICGYHFPFPGAGTIGKDGAGYALTVMKT